MSEAPDTKSVASAKSGHATRSGGTRGVDPRYLWLAFATLICALATWIALTQSPRPDPFQPVQMLSPDWWSHPVERNAFKRLPAIGGQLKALHANGDGRRLWAVGNADLIVHSRDGGRSWVQQTWAAGKSAQGGTDSAPRDTEQAPNKAIPGAMKQGWRSPSLISEAQAEASSPVQQQAPQAKSVQEPLPAVTDAKGAIAPATPSLPILRAVFFLPDGLSGWAVGDDGTILHTSGAGANWSPQVSGTKASLTAVAFSDALSGWAVGDDGTILHTSDAGANWSPQVSGTKASLTAVAFFDALSGWAVGDDGTILHTSDAGANWSPQASGTKALLLAVAFSDARSGWAVGSNGTILHTSDAGANWSPQTSGTTAWLNAVAFRDAHSGWAVGGDTILHTSDAGANWSPQTSGTEATLSAVAFSDARSGWAVGDDGTILHTSDAGANWSPQVSGTKASLTAVAFFDALSGWAVGDDGTILHTSDAGANWSPQASGTKALLLAVAFSDARSGWAVGLNGTILHTSDAGTNWSPQTSGTKAMLAAVAFPDARSGWAVGLNGTILHTSDAGTNWSPQTSGTKDLLAAVAFPDARSGWAVGGSGTILHTSDAGANWSPQTSGTKASLVAIAFPGGRSGWAVGDDGTILHTSDAGANWSPQTSDTEAMLNAVAFPDARNGWAVTRAGAILHTSDAGANWSPQASGTKALLLAVAFSDARSGWAVGEPSTILHTSDAGQTWQGGEQPGATPFVDYARYPAPWWYLALLAGIGSLSMALRPPPPAVRALASVADLALSDRPLEAGDRDALSFGPIALGLSNFLRNTGTVPPLTLAITGDWGSGKSSLMNLLRDDLRRRGFRPVWFNAWHQPADAKLLAALVSNIRQQALPPWLSREGLRFRWQLVWVRTRERPLWVAAMVFLAAYLFTYFGMQPAHLTAAIEWLPELAGVFGEDAKAKAGEDLLASFKSFAALLAVLGPLLTAWRGLKAFGVDPGKLASSLLGSVRQASAQSRFLNDYAHQFDEVAKALQPRTLTLFIDDLDRCPPERVREALEAINYLVSSGPCFIVLGMARERVEACVGLAFKEVAQELVTVARIDGDSGPAAARSDDAEARRHRRNYARDYLKKLVNIEVPVPQPDDRQAKGLVGALPDDAPPPPRAPAWRALTRSVTRHWPLLMVVSLAVLGWWSGVMTPDVATPLRPAAVNTALAEKAAVPSPIQEESLPQPDEPQKTSAAYLVPGQAVSTSWLAWLLPLLAILAVAAATLLRRPQVVEQDSRDFRSALAGWLPLVAARQNTPREVKRFVNRVRLLAMRQRAEGEGPAHLDEATLVALGALQHLDESLLDAPDIAGIETGQSIAESLNRAGHAWSGRIAKPLEDALAAHTRNSPWPPRADEVQRFRELVGSARLD